jgi:heme A synthase
MPARPPEARLAAAASAGLGLVLLVIVVSVAIRLDAEPLFALRGVHRTAASLEVLAALALAWMAWRRAALVIALTVFLSVLGIAAGQKPPPLAALGNLLGGLALAAAFAWALGRAHGHRPQGASRFAHAAVALFAVQCALGAWLALFAEELWSWALLAHAALGLALAAGAVWLALRLARAAQRFALLGAALAAPAAGIASALFEQPLAASLAHAAAGALLVAAAAYAHARLA